VEQESADIEAKSKSPSPRKRRSKREKRSFFNGGANDDDGTQKQSPQKKFVAHRSPNVVLKLLQSDADTGKIIISKTTSRQKSIAQKNRMTRARLKEETELIAKVIEASKQSGTDAAHSPSAALASGRRMSRRQREIFEKDQAKAKAEAEAEAAARQKEEEVKVKQEANDDGAPESSAPKTKQEEEPAPLDRLSPWELCPVDDEEAYQPPKLDPDVKEQVIKVIEDYESREDYETFFRYSVNLDVFTSYTSYVQVPICLDWIKTRLYNDYYRSVESVKFDVRLLQANCEAFNAPGSDVVVTCQTMADAIIAEIDAIGQPNSEEDTHSSSRGPGASQGQGQGQQGPQESEEAKEEGNAESEPEAATAAAGDDDGEEKVAADKLIQEDHASVPEQEQNGQTTSAQTELQQNGDQNMDVDAQESSAGESVPLASVGSAIFERETMEIEPKEKEEANAEQSMSKEDEKHDSVDAKATGSSNVDAQHVNEAEASSQKQEQPQKMHNGEQSAARSVVE